VIKLSTDDIEHLFKFRMVMELLAVETCIEKGCVPMEKLQQRLKALDRVLEKPKVNPLDFVEADLDFHEAVIQAAGNPYIDNVFRSIKYQLMTLLFSLYSHYTAEFSEKGVGQHHRMVDYLAGGDIEQARRHVREHIQNNLDFVMELNQRIQII
jgi:DNA-binding GntR family transcriptional regulator